MRRRIGIMALIGVHLVWCDPAKAGEAATSGGIPQKYLPLFNAARANDARAIRQYRITDAAFRARDEQGRTALHYAAVLGHVEALTALVETGGLTAPRDNHGRPPMALAAMAGKPESIQALHELGTDLNTFDAEGLAPIALAVATGQIGCAMALQALGADVHVRAKNGWTLAHYAVAKDLPDFMPTLKAWGVDLMDHRRGLPPLHFAAQFNRVAMLRALHAVGVPVEGEPRIPARAVDDIETIEEVEIVEFHEPTDAELLDIAPPARRPARLPDKTPVLDENDYPATVVAAFARHREALEALRAMGASFNATGRDGVAAIHQAAHDGWTDGIELIKNAGGDINAPAVNGWTPLHFAAARGWTATVRKLHQLGARLDAHVGENLTPARLAAVRGHAETAQAFAELGAREGLDKPPYTQQDVDALFEAVKSGNMRVFTRLFKQGVPAVIKGAGGMEPLHAAVSSRFSVHAVLREGADVGAKDNDDMTPLHYAAGDGNAASAASTLIKHGASLNAPSRLLGLTPMHIAVNAGQDRAARALLEGGADPLRKNKLGQTAFDGALSQGHAGIIRFFDHNGFGADDGYGEFVPSLAAMGLGGDSALLEAVVADDAAGLRRLRNAGERINETIAPMGIRPIHLAALLGRTRIIDTLHELGADLNLPAEKGQTAMQLAAESGQAHAVRRLHTHGAKSTVLEKGKIAHTAAHSAALNDRAGVLVVLADRQVDLTAVDATGLAPIHLAAFHGKKAALRCFIGLDVNPTVAGPAGMQAVHFAAAQGHTDALRVLEERRFDIRAQTTFRRGDALSTEAESRRIDPTARDAGGRTPLDHARAGKHKDAEAFLVEWIAKEAERKATASAPTRAPTATPPPSANAAVVSANAPNVADLLDAAHKGDLARIREFHQRGVDVNRGQDDGISALHLAVQGGHGEAVALLKALGADLETAENTAGVTPLLIAARSGKADMVTRLVALGADVNRPDTAGLTPLMAAALSDNAETTRVLLAAKADTARFNKRGYAAFHLAAGHGSLAVMRLLKEAGVDLNAPTRDGTVALFIAVGEGHADAVDLLAGWGVSVRATAGEKPSNKTPFTYAHYAAVSGRTEVLRRLVKHGADLHARMTGGITVAHIAAAEGDLVTLAALPALGADLTVQDDAGLTPAHHAAKNGHIDALVWLERNGANIHAAARRGTPTPREVAEQHNEKATVRWLSGQTVTDVTSTATR